MVRQITSIGVSGGEQSIPEMQISQSFHQMGIFVSDASGSMAGVALNGMRKDICVGIAVADIFSRFQGSSKQRNFSFAVVDFDDRAQRRLDVTEVALIDAYADYTPQACGSGGTFIGAGLQEAENIALAFLNSGNNEVPKSVIIVVLSDGVDGDETATLQVANRLKAHEKISLCTCYLAQRGEHDGKAESHLRNIASNPVRGFRTVYDPETIRGFFVASLSAGQKL